MITIAGVERHLGSWKPSALKLRGIKPSVDLVSLPMVYAIADFPTDYDQGSLGSCGPNSVAEIYEHDLGAKFSRLFLYWFTRATEGDFIDDTGVTIPDLMSVAHTMGMPLEDAWPYEIGKFQVPPPLPILVEAVRHRVDRWDPICDLDHLLFEVANNQPVTLGFNVPASIDSEATARSGFVNVPSDSDPVVGGHCVNAIGYDRGERWVRCTCHWGPDFGDGGTIKLPFAMFTSGNATDLAAIRAVS